MNLKYGRLMKNKVLLLLPLTALLCSCQTPPVVGPADCIQPCETKSSSDKDISGKLALDLNQINASGSVEAKYKNTLGRDYSALSDKNCLLLLGMRAIECYKKQRIIDQPTAQRMAQDALQAWRQAVGAPVTQAGAGGNVSARELKLINRSPEAGYIKAELAKGGLIRR